MVSLIFALGDLETPADRHWPLRASASQPVHWDRRQKSSHYPLAENIPCYQQIFAIRRRNIWGSLRWGIKQIRCWKNASLWWSVGTQEILFQMDHLIIDFLLLYWPKRQKYKRSRRKPKKQVEDDLLAEVQRLRAENEYLKNLQALVWDDKRC